MSNYSPELLEKYNRMNFEFQNAETDVFPDEKALAVMRENFIKDENSEFVMKDGRIVASECDVWPLFIKIEDSGLKDFLYEKAREIFSGLIEKNIKIYWPEKDSYHISVALLQDLRPCDMNDEKLLNTRLSKNQIDEIVEQIKPIINNYPALKLTLYGLSVGLAGSITAIFVDEGQYFRLQNEIGEKLNIISYIPERKYKKDIIHITLGRILEAVGKGEFVKIKESVKKYYDLIEKNWQIDVKEIILGHEIKWMHEKSDLKSEVRFSLK